MERWVHDQAMQGAHLMGRFQGKTAVVTGFGSGIGQAAALLLAAEGANVVGLSRNAESGEATVAAIRGQGGEATFVSTDIRSAEDVERAFEEAVRRYGSVDIAVNAAGIRATGPVTETPPERWADVLDTNLTGTFLVARAAALRMKEQGRGGAIINVSAISGFRGPSSRAAYGAAKAGVHNLTEAMALDHAGDGIRVNCVAPGPTATPMVGEITDEMRAGFAKRVPLGKIGEPEDIAEDIAYLASNAAKHVTGAILPVTGGAHLNV